MAVAIPTKPRSGASPASITIPATPAERNLLSAASAWIPPQTASDYLRNPARGGARAPERSITAGDLASWRGEHPTDPLRPPAGTDMSDKATLKSYRPPQHPASRVLHSIPPRAPSRSSRANILSYTLHLATSSRLSSYSSEAGSRQLLQLAELERDTKDSFEIDEAWFDAEQKTQGLWKLGANLLRSSRQGGDLPPSVLRRVELAGLAEEALLSPTADRAVTKIDSESVQASAQVEELVALKSLTAPDPTTLYHTTSASTTGLDSDASSGRPRVCSVAQSLIDLKFGGQADPKEVTSPVLEDHKPLSASPLDALASASDASGSAAAGPTTATPHMDYRIVLSQSMRTRARSIFAISPLPSLPASYCRRHRVRSCAVCHALVTAASERESNHAAMRRKNIPGAGLRVGDLQMQVAATIGGAGAGTKKPLAQLIPEFLKLSAALLRDVKDAANRNAMPEGKTIEGGEDVLHEALLADLVRTEEKNGAAAAAASSSTTATGKGKAVAADESGKASASSSGSITPVDVEIQVTAAWYDLLTGLLVQACLEGYLVDGWTGTEGVETLFGLGCGVWEGRGWSATVPLSAPSAQPAASIPRSEASRVSRRTAGTASDSSDDDDEEDAIDEATVVQRRKDQEATLLVEAGRILFGTRDVAQGDYERNMRDKTQEFLNVPSGKSLHQHLDNLNMQNPLSQFEDDLVDFLEATMHFLGKPALAKYDPRASAGAAPARSAACSSAGSAASGEPDPYALLKWFAPSTFGRISSLSQPRSSTPRQASPSGHDERSRKRVRAT